MTAADKALWLALDQGGHGSRALVFDAAGRKRAEAAEAVQTCRKGDRVELDADELVRSLQSVAEAACAQLGDESRHLQGAGLATQRSNILCWRHSDDKPLSPVLSWQDRRAEKWLAGLDHQTIREKTGLVPNPHYGASKMAWCLENLPEVQQANEQEDLRMGPMAGYLAGRLSGSDILSDPVSASRTLLWNIHDGDWDPALCQMFGISEKHLPLCVDSDHGFGSLILGTHRIPLNILTGDAAAALFASGQPQPETAYIVLGTGAFVQRLVEHPGAHPRLLDSILWQSKGQRMLTLEGTVNGAGSAFSWLADTHKVDENTLFENLPQWLEDVQQAPIHQTPLFLNAVSGIGSPFWQAHAQSRFDRQATLPEQAVAVLESVVFLLWLNMQQMAEVLPAPRSIRVSGGLSHLDGLCRKLAALSSLPVQRDQESEGSARGLGFLLSGGGSGWQSEPTVFEPEVDQALTQRWQNWLRFVSWAPE